MTVDIAMLSEMLGKRQRCMILSAREMPLTGVMKCPGKMKTLRTAGLAVSAWKGGDLLTPLGEQVRALLLKDNSDAG